MLSNLVRRTPRSMWESPLDLFQDLNQFMDRYGENSESYGTFGAYPVDIYEDEDHIWVEAEVPGFTKDQIDVTLENGVLTISAQRDEQSRNGKTPHLTQRHFTRINRRFTLPNTVNDQQVEATLNNGVLKLKLTKREEVRPRKIEVK